MENLTLLQRLKDFENHCITHDNRQGAEILSNAQKRIKELEEENSELYTKAALWDKYKKTLEDKD